MSRGRADLIQQSGTPLWRGDHLREAQEEARDELGDSWTCGGRTPWQRWAEVQGPARWPVWLEQRTKESKEMVREAVAFVGPGGESGSECYFYPHDNPVRCGCCYNLF